MGRSNERADRGAHRKARLAHRMNRAVIIASYDDHPWADILRAMRKASDAGAVWPAAAWRLAEAGRRGEKERARGRGSLTVAEILAH